LYCLGYILDIENRPIDEAIITDEISSSVSRSFSNGSYKLPVGEGKLLVILFT